MDELSSLRELPVKGHIFMGLKAEDTEQNEAIHSAFREMARVECRNDYTLALGKLLEYYQEDARFQMMWHEIEGLRAEVAELAKRIERKEAAPEGSGAF